MTGMDGRLLLRAEEEADLRVLSACVQDMAVKVIDIGWRVRAHQLVLVGNRFRWEAGEAATRVRAALRFDAVLRVERREWPEEPQAVLPLLAVTQEPANTGEEGVVLVLALGGGTALRLRCEALDVTLEDLSGPWGALATPDHGDPLRRR